MCRPLQKRERFNLDTFVDATEDIDLFQELLSKTWTIFGVSILFNFHSDEVHLKQYGKRLREGVASSLVEEDVAYTAEVCIIETIRPSESDPPPIKVEVYSENINDKENSKKSIYRGIFLSWRSMERELISNSIRLPLLLCRSVRGAMVPIHNVLSLLFDCTIIELPVNECDLMWLLPILIAPRDTYPASKGEKDVHMEYKVPGLQSTDSITVKYDLPKLIRILAELLNISDNDVEDMEVSFTLEHIQKFFEILHVNLNTAAGLQLGLCALSRIRFPACTIAGNRMKVMEIEAMYRILLYLNEKALDTLHPF